MKEYKEMISQPQYAMKQYAWVGYDEFEALSKYGDLANLFEELAEEYGRVPTQDEYVTVGFERAKEYFTTKVNAKGQRWLPVKKDPKTKKVLKWHDFKWEEKLMRAITQRLARSYPSHMVEYSTILTLLEKYPHFKVGASDYIDGVMAVDIVVASEEHDKVLYVHVTSSSGYSDHWLKKKESRKGFALDKNGGKHFYTRNFKKGHAHLAFGKTETDTTEIVNGIPVIKESHIDSVIEVAMILAPSMDTFKGKEQLCQLHYWLIENNISDNGLGNFWL